MAAMNDADRFRLLRTYSAPTYAVGAVVACALRGEVEITGTSSGLIPRPVARTTPRGRARFLAVYGDLVEAVRAESRSGPRTSSRRSGTPAGAEGRVRRRGRG